MKYLWLYCGVILLGKKIFWNYLLIMAEITELSGKWNVYVMFNIPNGIIL